MPYIDIDYLVLITDEHDYHLEGGLLYEDRWPLSFEPDAELEFYTLVDNERENLDNGDSYLIVRTKTVWED